MKKTGFVPLLIAVASLVLSAFALLQSFQAKSLAQSEIAVEEENYLALPTFDEESSSLQYLVLFDLSVTNHSGPPVKIAEILPANQGLYASFLDGEEIASADIPVKAFSAPFTIAEFKKNPRLLKEAKLKDLKGEKLHIAAGESKVLHLGLLFSPYNPEKKRLVSTALCSFQIVFDNGKSFWFRRAVPVYPIE
ncbi:MAG: hypothetical protein ONB24_08860 [candidate division KSB1 bacterium]|nr:hypothetical protein [candidate division KSB1 bacterium]